MSTRFHVTTSLACLALVHLCGCAASSSSPSSLKPVAVVVLDAETGRPIPRTAVTVQYANVASKSAHPTIRRETDADGQATVFASGVRPGAPEAAPEWRIEAPGYVTYWAAARPGQSVPAAIRQAEDAAAPGPHVIRLYTQPAPTVAVVVAERFRGKVLLHITPADGWIQDDAPGRREFTFKPDADGRVEIAATPLLSRELCRAFGFASIHFQTREGRELQKDWAIIPALSKSRAPPALVRARLISSDPKWEGERWLETHDLYVIGTAADARAVTHPAAENSP